MNAVGQDRSHGSDIRLVSPAVVGVAILFLGVVVNLFDRQVINVLAEDIKAEMHLSDAALGLLTGTAFGLFYAAVGIPAGCLADRVDRRKLISAMVAVWSVSTTACGLATNYFMLAMARTGVGMGEGGAQAAGTALVADLAPEKWRSSALSLMLVGVPIGMLLGYFVGGFAAQAWGWRVAFLLAGLPGLIVSLLIYAFVRDPRRPGTRSPEACDGSMRAAVVAVARKPRMGLLAIGLSASGFDAYATNAWIPSFFIRAHGLSIAEIGVYGALAVGIGGAMGVAGAGPACDFLRARTPRPEALLLIIGTSLGVPWLLLMTLTADTGLALFAMAMFQVSAFAWLAPAARLIQDAAGPANRALGVALCGTASTIFTLCIGIPAIGLASDLLTPVTGNWSVGYALCLSAVVVAFCGTTAYWRVFLSRENEAG